MKRRDFLKMSAGTAAATVTGAERAMSQAMPAVSSLDKIEHVVVLMLENRSFDNLLGMLYPRSETFDGLTGEEFNLDASGQRIKVNNRPGLSGDVLTTPNPNPGESWSDINEQLFGSPAAPDADAVPDMSGFVRNYQRQTSRPASRYDPRQIMHYFTPEQVPVLSLLARQFAVSDRWFASSPTQTWPNRFFVHTGTGNSYENNLPPHFPYRMPTIFERLHARDATNGWRVYYHDIPQSLTLSNLWKYSRHFSRFGKFLEHAGAGTLPKYAFIEPDYFPVRGRQSDEHPPSSVAAGEALIADVYNALRQGPAWTKTLLIITFDEHGGCYDHVPPPLALPPSDAATTPFGFDRFGVRVPAVFVSPYIAAGQVLRPVGATPFDHTSIIATLRRRFELGPPLTDRDAAAPTIEAVLNLPAPTNIGPERIDAPEGSLRGAAAVESAAAGEAGPITDLQQSLRELSDVLPAPGDEEAQIRRLEAAPAVAERRGPELRSASPAATGQTVDQNVRRFLGEN